MKKANPTAIAAAAASTSFDVTAHLPLYSDSVITIVDDENACSTDAATITLLLVSRRGEVYFGAGSSTVGVTSPEVLERDRVREGGAQCSIFIISFSLLLLFLVKYSVSNERRTSGLMMLVHAKVQVLRGSAESVSRDTDDDDEPSLIIRCLVSMCCCVCC